MDSGLAPHSTDDRSVHWTDATEVDGFESRTRTSGGVSIAVVVAGSGVVDAVVTVEEAMVIAGVVEETVVIAGIVEEEVVAVSVGPVAGAGVEVAVVTVVADNMF